MQTKGRFDPNSPEIKAHEQELGHRFVREGTMVALFSEDQPPPAHSFVTDSWPTRGWLPRRQI